MHGSCPVIKQPTNICEGPRAGRWFLCARDGQTAGLNRQDNEGPEGTGAFLS